MIFKGFPKIPRLIRNCIITEKIDGTNGCIYIGEDGEFLVGSRTRWITPHNDNYGFAKWAEEHKEELLALGAGTHWGEWWGNGIQRGYGLPKGDKRFSLFNTSKWSVSIGVGVAPPACLSVVPVLYKGVFSTTEVNSCINWLRINGSIVSQGFMYPEGVVVYHSTGNILFKQTIEKDSGKDSA